jgi:peptidoglycan/xylan/chitin deacetylase (PgdA/CDA1 family)
LSTKVQIVGLKWLFFDILLYISDLTLRLQSQLFMPFALVFYYFIAFLGNISPFLDVKLTGTHPKIGINTGGKNVVADLGIKTIYLSFDDGPLTGTTNCIDICTRENVMATFFEVGLHQSRSAFGKKTYQQISNNPSLFALANHSYSHASNNYLYFYQHPDSAVLDFLKAKTVLQPTNNITRLPGNNAWNLNGIKRASPLVLPLVNKLDSVGFNIIGWDLQWRFNKMGRPIQSPATLAVIVDSLFQHHQTVTKNQLVILMHDHMFRAPADSLKLEKFIQLLKKRGQYRFRKLTQYPGLKLS